jgi:Protein of unknown function (DUF3046)
MRLSEFWLAVSEEFGAYGQVVTNDLVLRDVGDRSAVQALAAGIAPREVWLALCAAADVPKSRWYGAGRRAPKQHS